LELSVISVCLQKQRSYRHYGTIFVGHTKLADDLRRQGAAARYGEPNYRAEQEAAERARQREWKRQQEQRQKNRDKNRRLLDAVLDCIPKALTRADYETLALAAIERLQYEDWEAVCDYYAINTDEVQEPDAAAFESCGSAFRTHPNRNWFAC
jgi:hypothetical protein